MLFFFLSCFPWYSASYILAGGCALGMCFPVSCLLFILCSLISLYFSSLVASQVVFHFAMFAILGLDNVFLRVCGVSLLEFWSLLFRVLWFFVGMSALCAVGFVREHVRLAGGSFVEVSSYLQGRLMQSSHGGEGCDTRMLILLARED
ncbi:hypothetical protein F2Q68_00005331 [Brassica cretica]|uniref:Uncharacterized protein n=1 Tax=Brassica cretica TaxID=69181 RepID=A0A3N6RAE2_BRACR|nr:hypothetical protein F2Q68_00005331 [Brassica cretica]